MTAQASNSVISKKEEYDLLGYTNEGLVKPQDFGINPIMASTMCWRGYITTYEVDEESNFKLQKLRVNTEPEDEILPINDILPSPATNKLDLQLFRRHYDKLNLPVNYSGFILIGKGFIRELYVHMGFHPAWKFKEVYELEIDRGKVISTQNLSEKMEQYRAYVSEEKRNKRDPDKPKDHMVETWIKQTFDQKYNKG